MPKATKPEVPNVKIRKFNPEILEKRRLRGSPPTIVIIGKRGTGKSLGYNTPVIRYDGSVEMIQNIKVGDKLMGDDSKPRTVLAATKAKEPLFRVKQNKGDDYVVNEDHVLSLMVVKTNTPGKPINLQGKKLYRGDKIDISVKDYMKLSKTTRKANLKGYSVPVEFPEKEVPVDPYLLGLWLGDGHSDTCRITNQDSTVIKYLKENVGEYDCFLQHIKDYTYSVISTGKGKKNSNQFLSFLRNHDLLKNKHIPHLYKCNSREIRLSLLAGLIDTDGTLDHANNFDIIQKNYGLAKDIEFVARSLGFRCNVKECTKTCQTGASGTYYRMNISGEGIDEIPCLIPRKQARPYNHNKFSLCTGIDIEPVEQEYYDQGEEYHYRYSIQLDGNHRFLLEDFTVTHNSTLVSDLMWHIRLIPMLVCMSGTEEGNHFYRQYLHQLCIHGDYKDDIVSNMIRKQKEKMITCDKHGINPDQRPDLGVGLLLDDCGYDNSIMKKKDIRMIFMNGRHWKITYIVSLQYMMDIPPALRTNIDYVFALRENIEDNQKKLHKYFFGVFPKFAQFQEAFTACTNNYECLVLDNTSKSTKITDQVFWYKATPNRQFKIGSKDLWDYLDQRFNPNHDDEEEEGIQPQRNSGISIKKAPMVKIVDSNPPPSNDQYPGNRNSYQSYAPDKVDYRDQYHRRR